MALIHGILVKLPQDIGELGRVLHEFDSDGHGSVCIEGLAPEEVAKFKENKAEIIRSIQTAVREENNVVPWNLRLVTEDSSVSFI